jgi:hypothetical protein
MRLCVGIALMGKSIGVKEIHSASRYIIGAFGFQKPLWYILTAFNGQTAELLHALRFLRYLRFFNDFLEEFTIFTILGKIYNFYDFREINLRFLRSP